MKNQLLKIWQGKYEELVQAKGSEGKFSYKFVKNSSDFNEIEKYSVIFVEYLNPEYFIFFSKIKHIVTKKGSALSHLSILAREYGVSIIRANFPQIPLYGKVEISKKRINVFKKK